MITKTTTKTAPEGGRKAPTKMAPDSRKAPPHSSTPNPPPPCALPSPEPIAKGLHEGDLTKGTLS